MKYLPLTLMLVAGLLVGAGLAPTPGAVPSILDYGAVPNDQGDDTAAINAAILATQMAGGGPLRVPPGTYRVSDQITLRSNVALRGEPGSLIAASLAPPQSYVIVSTGIRDAEVSGLRIDGSFAQGIFLDQVERCVISRCWISGATSERLAGTTAGVYLARATDCRVESCHFSGNGYIDCDGPHGSDITIGAATPGSTRNRITGNTCLSTAVYAHIDLYDSSWSEVSGNICSGARTGGDAGGYGIVFYEMHAAGSTHHNIASLNRISSTQGTGIYVKTSPDSVVSGNVLSSVCTAQGDAVLAAGGIVASVSPRCVLSGNTLNGSGKAGISVGGGSHGSVVSGNTITATGNLGIWIRQADDVTCSGNVVRDTWGGIGQPIAGLPMSRLVLTGNLIGPTRGATSGIVLVGVSDAVLVGNLVDRAGGTGLVLQNGSNGTITNNRITNASQAGAGIYEMIRCDQSGMTITGNTGTGALPWASLVVSGQQTDVIIRDNSFSKPMMLDPSVTPRSDQ